jgi:hypothetical protein
MEARSRQEPGMSKSIVCSYCGKVLPIDEKLVGKLIRCGSCAHVFVVPGKASPEAWSDPLNSPPDLGHKDQGGKAIASLVLGILGLVCWCLPILGLPMTIVGLVLGFKGQRSPNHGLAIAGLVLNTIGLMFSIVNAAIGAYLGATGQHPLLNSHGGLP